MKKELLTLLAAVLAVGSLAACGDDDDEQGGEVILPTPKVVSTTPADGATGLNTGDISLTVSYDQAVTLVRSKIYLIKATGATVGTPTVSDKTLSLTVSCPTQATQVTVSLPEGLVTNAQGAAAPALQLSFTTKEPEPTPSDGQETAAEAVRKMIGGWNLGNTLDAWSSGIAYGSDVSSYETCWGQPVTDAHLMKAFKEKGFTAIRVPVTWFQKMDDEGNVRQEWMQRVQQVVDYVLDANLYCILNVHHDTGAGDQAWLRADKSYYDKSNARYKKLWTQIATHFQNYDQRLLFEGYNEVLNAASQWNQPGNLSDLQYINAYAQDFVDAVRATGGKNLYRNLIVTTYCGAHGQQVLEGLTIPTDPCGVQTHLAVEVHSYDPWDWVNTYKMKWTSQCTKTAQDMFALLNRLIIQKGYPVIIGEYGSNGNNEKTINKNSSASEKQEAGRQAADITRLCKQYGAAAFYWMGIVDGKDRSEASFKWSMEQVADSIVNVYK